MRYLLALLTMLVAGPAWSAQYPGYPANAIPVIVDTGNVPEGPINIEMPPAPGFTNYLAAVACTGTGATAASNVLMVLGSFPDALLGTVNLTWIYATPAGITVAAPGVAASFDPPLVGQDGGAIGLNVAAVGAGNTHLSCNMRGYRAPSQ